MKQEGTIIKGIGGFYYVHDGVDTVYECRARGVFRNQDIKPLVGDHVTIEILDAAEKNGNLMEIFPRKNQLIRPASANVDQALILFACAAPEPNLNLLDRMLISMEVQDVPCIICFGKTDLIRPEQEIRLRSVYEKSGCPVEMISVYQERGLSQILSLLEGKITVMAGPSGVGKSSLLNKLCPEACTEVGEISKKNQRGRNTTRHTELFYLKQNTFIMDTPGFSSLELMELSVGDLKYYYAEFDEYEGQCRFLSCVHMEEPGCKVKEAVETGKIPSERYASYRYLYQNLKEANKY